MPSRAAVVSLFAALLTLAACSCNRPPAQADSQLSFGVDMARRGLWKEALFRFEAAERLDPDNPRIQSDLGVAYEASGQFDKALSYYQKALKLAPTTRRSAPTTPASSSSTRGTRGTRSEVRPGEGHRHDHHKARGAGAEAVSPGPAEPSTPGDAPPPPTDAPPRPRPPVQRPVCSEQPPGATGAMA